MKYNIKKFDFETFKNNNIADFAIVENYYQINKGEIDQLINDTFSEFGATVVNGYFLGFKVYNIKKKLDMEVIQVEGDEHNIVSLVLKNAQPI